MLENLGQSQVLPYLRGLANRGATIDLLSFELDASSADVEELRDSLAARGITWSPLRRRRDSRLSVKVRESAVGVVRAFARAARRAPDIVHGRSYFSTAICDVVATTFPRAKLIFDCRGMIGDEYVDAGYWQRDRIEYRLVKRYEARAFRRSEGVVVLTNALRRWVSEHGYLGPRTRIEAIPCCVDLERFRFDPEARTKLRTELGLQERIVIVYAGSLGSWYREPDLARFAGILKRRSQQRIAFLVLTPSSSDELVRLLEAEGLQSDEIVVRRARPSEMAQYLSVGDIGLSFITSCFSKKGSSPTKVAEYLACGLPVVVNGDIGDQADLAIEKDACVVLTDFSDAALASATDDALRLMNRPINERVAAARRVAMTHFGLENVGVDRYERLYEHVLGAA